MNDNARLMTSTHGETVCVCVSVSRYRYTIPYFSVFFSLFFCFCRPLEFMPDDHHSLSLPTTYRCASSPQSLNLRHAVDASMLRSGLESVRQLQQTQEQSKGPRELPADTADRVAAAMKEEERGRIEAFIARRVMQAESGACESRTSAIARTSDGGRKEVGERDRASAHRLMFLE